MATTAFTSWYDDVVPFVKGCPLALALQKIRSATIDYCRITHAWRYLDATAINSVASQRTYVLGVGATVGTLPADTIVVHAFQVNYEDEPLTPVKPTDLPGLSATWSTDEDTPQAFTLFQEGELTLWPRPASSVTGAIKIPDVALAPSQAATGVDDRIHQRGREAIAAGALAKIFLVPGKPYTNLQLGEFYEARFGAMAGGAGARVSSGQGHTRLRTQTIGR